jgi:hypothetical protein
VLYWLCFVGVPFVINNISCMNLILPYDTVCYHVGKWYQSSAVCAVVELVRCHVFRQCSFVYFLFSWETLSCALVVNICNKCKFYAFAP